MAGGQFTYYEEDRRRLRKAVPALPRDGAGLLNVQRHYVTDIQTRGKGCPPPSDKESQFKFQKRGGYASSQSFWETDPHFVNRPSTADDLKFKPAKRMLNCSFESKIYGGAAILDESAELNSPRQKKVGLARPNSSIEQTSKNILSTGYKENELAQHLTDGYRTRMGAVWRRPHTADTLSKHREHTLSLKLASDRTPAPQILQQSHEAKKTVYFDALDAYCANKCAAMIGAQFRFG